MTPGDPLAALHPLRAPEPIGWWPPAPGWWLLLVLVLVAVAVLAFLLVRRYRANAYRRAGLRRLQLLHTQLMADADILRFVTDTNALLKAVALRAYPAESVAPSHGQAWLNFLNTSTEQSRPFPAVLATAAYTADADGIDAEDLYRAAEHWIRHHRGTP